LFKSHVAAGFKAPSRQDQTGVGVVEEQIVPHHRIAANVVQVNAKLLAAIDVISLVAQTAGSAL